MSLLSPALRTLDRLQPLRISGRVAALRGLVVLVHDLPLPVGSLVEIGDARIAGEVVGFDARHSIVMTLGNLAAAGIRPGDRVVGRHASATIGVGRALRGRVINGLGQPIDGKGPITGTSPRDLEPPPLGPMARRRISEPMVTGVRAIDLFTTLGRGQRLGIFAGPGVGKSTLLGSIARCARSDVNVVALIGERGREVKDFIEESLGEEGLARSVVVVATGDESPLMRVRAALVACAIAEGFRDAGDHVLLMMDSVTRLAHAQRQIGLSVGEPPATRGYTPSVFAFLARLLERAGSVESGGSVTGLYTVLVEGDDMTEPVADAARGILDGHIILSRKLAQRAHFPAIDVLDSVSRVADEVTDATHIAARRQCIRLLALHREVEDLVQIGAYARGSSPETDIALAYHPRLIELLRQDPGDTEPFEQAKSRMIKTAVEAGAALQNATKRK